MTVNTILEWALGIFNDIDVVCRNPDPNKHSIRTLYPNQRFPCPSPTFPPTFHSFYCHLA